MHRNTVIDSETFFQLSSINLKKIVVVVKILLWLKFFSCQLCKKCLDQESNLCLDIQILPLSLTLTIRDLHDLFKVCSKQFYLFCSSANFEDDLFIFLGTEAPRHENLIN